MEIKQLEQLTKYSIISKQKVEFKIENSTLIIKKKSMCVKLL